MSANARPTPTNWQLLTRRLQGDYVSTQFDVAQARPMGNPPPDSRPRELEALRLVEQRPGITVAELADEIGVSMQRAWQYVNGSRLVVCGWNRKRIGAPRPTAALAALTEG